MHSDVLDDPDSIAAPLNKERPEGTITTHQRWFNQGRGGSQDSQPTRHWVAIKAAEDPTKYPISMSLFQKDFVKRSQMMPL